MQNLWNEHDAQSFSNELDLRVYSSRLLGQDKSLVLHGGGNTSVKIDEKNILGEIENILYVKGSGWDLADIEPLLSTAVPPLALTPRYRSFEPRSRVPSAFGEIEKYMI